MAHGRQNEGDKLLERVGMDSSEHFAANPLFFSMSVLSLALQCFSPESVSANWNDAAWHTWPVCPALEFSSDNNDGKQLESIK